MNETNQTVTGEGNAPRDAVISFMALVEVARDAEALLNEIANKVPLSEYGISTLPVRSRLHALLTCPAEYKSEAPRDKIAHASAYKLGWIETRQGRSLVTSKMVAEAHPGLQGSDIATYLNAVDDAVKNDDHRLNLILAREARIALGA